MVNLALVIVLAELGQSPNEALFFQGISPPVTSAAPMSGKFTRLEGLDKVALISEAKSLAAKHKGVKAGVLQGLKDFAHSKLNVEPPYMDAEIADFTNMAEDACKPYVKPVAAPPPPPPIKRYAPAKPEAPRTFLPGYTDPYRYEYRVAPQYYQSVPQYYQGQGGCANGACGR